MIRGRRGLDRIAVGFTTTSAIGRGPGGSMNKVVGLPNKSYKPITNTGWVCTRLSNLQKGCTRLAAASDQVYQLLAKGRWFSPGTPASSITKCCRHDIAEILLKVALSTTFNIQKFKMPMRSVPITSDVRLPLPHCEGVQHYVIRFVSDLREVSGFLRILRFLPPIQLTTTI